MDDIGPADRLDQIAIGSAIGINHVLALQHGLEIGLEREALHALQTDSHFHVWFAPDGGREREHEGFDAAIGPKARADDGDLRIHAEVAPRSPKARANSSAIRSQEEVRSCQARRLSARAFSWSSEIPFRSSAGLVSQQSGSEASGSAKGERMFKPWAT